MRCFGLIFRYGDNDEVFFKIGEKSESCVDAEICEILKFWKCSFKSTIMVPCQVEQDETDQENRYHVSLPSEMINEYLEDLDSDDEGSELAEQQAVSAAVPEQAVPQPATIVAAEDSQANDFTRRHDLMFTEMKTWSSSIVHLHKEEYPFVITAFAAEGLKQTPPNMVLYYSRRIGLFHVKKDTIIGNEGGVDQYLKGIVCSPNQLSYLTGIPQPESAKSVKIVKTFEIIFKGCALLGYNHNPADREKAEKWIGWNDYTGLLSFDFACTRLLKMKHRDFDWRCGFVMFSATLTRNGKWKVKEISYSRQEIVENECQMPLDICFVDQLSIAHQSHTEIKLISSKMETWGGKPLVVSCKREHFDSSEVEQRVEYGAVIVPCYSENGKKVEFQAMAVLPNHKWADPSTHFHRLAAILPTWESWLQPIPETSYFLDVQMEKGYL